MTYCVQTVVTDPKLTIEFCGPFKAFVTELNVAIVSLNGKTTLYKVPSETSQQTQILITIFSKQ